MILRGLQLTRRGGLSAVQPRGSLLRSKLQGVSRNKSTGPLGLTDHFIDRHVGPSEQETQEMLSIVGYSSVEELMDSAVPPQIRLQKPLDLPPALSEEEATAELMSIAAENKLFRSFIGMGYYNTFTPKVIQRNMIENPGWYTAYTPYQSEVSQGRLEGLLNFQTMIMDMTGLDVANASLLDEGTAAAEAMAMCFNNSKKKNQFFVSHLCHPQTIAVVRTRAEYLGIEVVVGRPENVDIENGNFCGAMVQYPDTHGNVTDYEAFAKRVQDSGALVVAACDLLALAKLKPPGEWGANIAIGTAQRFGTPLFFGGPHAGFIAVEEKYHRRLPGRIIGVSVDSQNKPALRMAMQTREQHIRRDKASSNICTAQALLANVAAAFAVYHGPKGIRAIADRVHFMTSVLAEGLQREGFEIVNDGFFDTLQINLRKRGLLSAEIELKAWEKKINIRKIDSNHVGVSLDETVTKKDLENLFEVFGIQGKGSVDEIAAELTGKASNGIPERLVRKSKFLAHPVFNSHHSETKMMRYLKSLENKDVGLNRSMIALGSCTMKLNAVAELQPVSWPEFANLHPFVPADQCIGYTKMMGSLHAMLAEITGFAAVTSQPNSGAQGEYAGLLAIRKHHEACGHAHRNICLIPMSAHGTNPASAVMAGMKVVAVKNEPNGNIDLKDLKSKVEKHSENLGAIMVTYPSTYGVYEESIKDICDLVHAHGGQVYMDGANMNAQCALTSPGYIGADVCHLNLHKTFCIPHGGGGPGVGTIAVADHLAPHLCGHTVVNSGGDGTNTFSKAEGAVSAAPFGSAGILPIPWMYLKMLGEEGLRKATSMAVLNANYMSKRLEEHYNVVFRGRNGLCAHEFIIDIRPFKKVGITEEDIAKRLQDYGFHSPTMSWPVMGTMMIEPTESEAKDELDRLVDAFIMIRKEIADIEEGRIAVEDSPLKHAPHTVDVVLSESWDRKYSRDVAVFPAPWTTGSSKYWPSVGRVDNVYGDKNLACSCPPMESYASQDKEAMAA